MTEKKMQIKPYPLGAHRETDSIRFSFVSGTGDCGIVLFDKKTGKEINRIPFSPEESVGNVYCKYVKNIDDTSVSYQFYQGEELVPDAYARGFAGTHCYAGIREEKDLKAIILNDDFDWENDKNPRLPYYQCVCYCMHVRGFTKHPSSKVVHKGTFLGIVEKIPYLKESGVTTLELQPAYEFLELPSTKEIMQETTGTVVVDEYSKKLNYWGYKRGYYYAPKAAYAAGDDPVVEFKTTIKELHKNGLEAVMQFYFPKDVNRGEIADILRFWVLEYHVDGFHLMGEKLPVEMLAKDASLADTKLWYDSFDTEEIYDKGIMPSYCNLAEYRDDYLYTMRKYLKGDDHMLNSVIAQMRYIPNKAGRIHYMSNYYGLTLWDMVSYDGKHNEENGENNRDGNDYNCSWNCGEEGNTRKKKVIALRYKQWKNAICMLFLTQSTPLIFMGDEFCNTQYGNNNPYCQDNKTTWLDWGALEKNLRLYEFWKAMMNLRREHPVLRPERELRIMDYIACGYPDLSYHGKSAWRPQLDDCCRQIGMMYCGKYAKKKQTEEDSFFYVAMNMHWEPHELALPKLPKGYVWKNIISTGELPIKGEPIEDAVCRITGRSILVFQSVADSSKQKRQKNISRSNRTLLCEDSVNDRTIF